MPRGNEIAVYSTYLAAQKAVDALSDNGFPVQTVTIVGHDLHMVERVTGRLTYPRVALAGFASGAWFGLFVGLLLGMFGNGTQGSIILSAVLIGGAFGLLFSVLSYALTGGKRDFTSQSQIVAAHYVLLCLPETAGKARALLMEKGVSGDVTPNATATPQTTVSRPPAQPQYGAQAPGAHVAGGTPPAGAGAPGEPPMRPRTYGEALDAQRQAAREQSRTISNTAVSNTAVSNAQGDGQDSAQDRQPAAAPIQNTAADEGQTSAGAPSADAPSAEVQETTGEGNSTAPNENPYRPSQD